MTAADAVAAAFLAVTIGGLIAWAGVMEWRAARRRAAARKAASRNRLAAGLAARHPSWRRRVPGLPVDGEPLTAAELYQFTAIMLRPVREPLDGNDNAEGPR